MLARKDTVRKLSLNKETLRQLTRGELRRAVGGRVTLQSGCYTVTACVKPRL